MIEIENKKILVTGANSMIGRSIVEKLKSRGAIVYPVYHSSCDLLDIKQVDNFFNQVMPDYCIHAAGYNGNIKFNSLYPADIFYNTAIMGLNVLKMCVKYNVKKIVTLLASCAYQSTDQELNEKDFFLGMPDESVEAHGLSKKTLFYFSRQIYKQHDIKAVCTIFNTAYGPYDSFKLEKTKVVGGLIKKFVDAVENNNSEVECWGTGNPRRELIYSADAAEGVIQVLEKYDCTESPINVGFNEDISIKDLANLISEITGYKGKIIWNDTYPDGQFKKILNSSRMKEFNIEIKERTSLRDGLEKTIKWYKENYK